MMQKLGALIMLVYFLFAACILFLASCGHSEPTPRKPWKDMDHDERFSTMKKVVQPAMKAEFTKFNAKLYDDFDCATCHGAGAKDHSFKMPNPKLPKLPTSEAGIRQLREKHPEVVAFMSGTVVPKMAAFLGEAPYDPKTHEGFGCFRCHTKAD